MDDRLIPVRPPRRNRKRLQTPNPEVRQRLMAATAELIRDGDYAALRIEDIAERAGLSVGTFYLYFDGKADLFVNLVQEYTLLLRERMNAASAGAADVAESLMRGFDAYLDFVLENERAFLHFVRASGTLATNAGLLSTWAFNAHAADMLPGVKAAIDQGVARKANPTLVAQAIIGLTQHMVVYWLEHKDICTRDELKAFVNGFIAFGLATATPQSS